MVKRKQAEVKDEPSRGEIEAALLETAEKTAAQPSTEEIVVHGRIPAAKCSTCGGNAPVGYPCPTDGQVN